MTHPRRMIVGISGASGVVYGKRILELLRDLEIETHLIMSRAACITLAAEATFSRQDLEALATTTHSNKDIGAVCSSGSYKTLGMIVAPLFGQDAGRDRHGHDGQPHFPCGRRGAERTSSPRPDAQRNAASSRPYP